MHRRYILQKFRVWGCSKNHYSFKIFQKGECSEKKIVVLRKELIFIRLKNFLMHTLRRPFKKFQTVLIFVAPHPCKCS